MQDAVPSSHYHKLCRITCVACSRQLPLAIIKYGRPFECPYCAAEIRVSYRYCLYLGYLSIVAAIVVAFVFGARGLVLLPATVLAFVPANVVLGLIGRKLLPPRTEMIGEEQAS